MGQALPDSRRRAFRCRHRTSADTRAQRRAAASADRRPCRTRRDRRDRRAPRAPEVARSDACAVASGRRCWASCRRCRRRRAPARAPTAAAAPTSRCCDPTSAADRKCGRLRATRTWSSRTSQTRRQSVCYRLQHPTPKFTDPYTLGSEAVGGDRTFCVVAVKWRLWVRASLPTVARWRCSASRVSTLTSAAPTLR